MVQSKAPLGQDFLLAINPTKMVVVRIEIGSTRVIVLKWSAHTSVANTVFTVKPQRECHARCNYHRRVQSEPSG